MTFDGTITLGALINAAIIAIGFIVAFVRIGGRIDLLALRMTAVEDFLKAQRDVTERLAIIETRQATHGTMIANLQTDMQDVRRGRGFIRDRASGGIDGEYP
jgi:hypothetical protein